MEENYKYAPIDGKPRYLKYEYNAFGNHYDIYAKVVKCEKNEYHCFMFEDGYYIDESYSARTEFMFRRMSKGYFEKIHNWKEITEEEFKYNFLSLFDKLEKSFLDKA